MWPRAVWSEFEAREGKEIILQGCTQMNADERQSESVDCIVIERQCSPPPAALRRAKSLAGAQVPEIDRLCRSMAYLTEPLSTR